MNKLNYENLLKDIRDPNFNEWDDFFISLVTEFNNSQESKQIRDLLFNLMIREKDISGYMHIVNELFNEVGLFPYVKEKDFKKSIQHLMFKSPTNNGYTFHQKQLEVFSRIINGENIILSAPTSFGKSLIIEAIVGSCKFDNIMVIVPSIALMDEARFNLSAYNNNYKIITQLSQTPSNKNVYIFTQERFLDLSENIDIDFFIIDEFYKLHPTMSGDLERCARLNSCLNKLLKLTNRFYMCGPNINGLEGNIEKKLNCRLITLNDYATVSTEIEYFEVNKSDNKSSKKSEKNNRKKILFKILNKYCKDEQTIIFCKSPGMAQEITGWIVDKTPQPNNSFDNSFSEWISNNYHSDWLLSRSIKYGVAFHHGKLPRAISSIIVDSFSKKIINTLVCTSTLIEGVNTNAKNIIMFDTKINDNEIDLFTFNNIAGRSGRMLKHFVGNVYVIGSKPKEELPSVDIPIITQSDNATDSMLLDVPQSSLTSDNALRVSKFYQQDNLPIEIIRKHSGIDPDKLINLAKDIESKAQKWHPLMNWTSNKPSNDQLLHLCMLCIDYFDMKHSGVTSDKQLKLKINTLMYQRSDKEQIASSYENDVKQKDKKIAEAIEDERAKCVEKGLSEQETQKKIETRLKRFSSVDINKVILNVFAFKRSYVGFKLPRIISAISDIQKHVFGNYKYSYGNYSAFSHDLESYFDNPLVQTLEEFGIPAPLGKKLLQMLPSSSSLDEILDSLPSLQAAFDNKSEFSEFETNVLNRAIDRLRIK
ncbi:DEAD/DEAH box helicase [Vibrio parahaemolyticus]|uniref:DEAD/DEAH box helicase n=1 Tax=Vibrio parahaemolyticus TaxID=670 RepID=UPI00387B1AFF